MEQTKQSIDHKLLKSERQKKIAEKRVSEQVQLSNRLSEIRCKSVLEAQPRTEIIKSVADSSDYLSGRAKQLIGSNMFLVSKKRAIQKFYSGY